MLRRLAIRRCAGMNVRKEIEAHVARINTEVLKPLDPFDKFVPRNVYSTPMVMLLGNHSAGKSTFINSLLGADEQQTGVAPTDDGFTVLMRGEVEMTEDGLTAVANPKHGLQDLQAFGKDMVHHLRVKTRVIEGKAAVLPKDMMIIDTPGMIDAPAGSRGPDNERLRRGYDFLGATKWFAQRADVILLMFDPANPGTTSETLSVLTESLVGQEHKFLIIFNKVDVFDRVIDFARAYGALCWNLSKVIHTKDIPRIYTTFTPTFRDTASTAAVPRAELEKTRDEVVREIMRAPQRRLDNMLTETEEAARRVLLCGAVCNALRRQTSREKAARFGILAAALVAAPSLVGSVYVGLGEIAPTVLTGVGSALGLGMLWSKQAKDVVVANQRVLLTLDEVFRTEVGKMNLTQELEQRWELVKPVLVQHIEHGGVESLPTFSARQLERAAAVLKTELPELRRQVDAYKPTMQNK